MNTLFFRRSALLTLLLAGGSLTLLGDVSSARFIAHRGESLDAPENTLAAFQLAVDRQTAGFECDIYLTADNEIVCIHDATTTRTTGTNLTVAASTLAQLRALDAGSWKGARFAGERIPTLAETLSLARDGFEIYVEIKCGVEILPRLSEVLAAEPDATPERVVFLAFSTNVIKTLRQQLPDYRAYWLTNTKLNTDGSVTPTAAAAVAAAKGCGAAGIDAQATAAISPAYVSAVQAAGLSFHVWTVNVATQATALAEMGVETISSDGAAALAAYRAAASSTVPVLHWSFDGTPSNCGGGGPYYDATLIGSPVYTNGIAGQGLRLDGVDDFVSAPCRLSDQGTISLWFKPDAFYDYNCIFDNPADPNKWEAWIYKDGRLRFRVNTDGSGDVAYDLHNLNGSNHWCHVALTWDKAASNVVLYVNGIALADDALTAWAAPGAAFYLGGGNAGNMKGRGVVDEVRVYGAALSASQVRAVFQAHNESVYLPLDGTAADRAGGDNGAALSGTPAFAKGRIGLALSAIGPNGATNNAAIPCTLAEEGTLALWYYARGPWYNYQSVFDNSANQDWWEMWIYNTGVLAFRVKSDGSGDVRFDLDNLRGPNQWYHIAVTWNRAADRVRLYIDGIERANDPLGAGWVAPGSTVYLGGHAGNTPGSGLWDEVRIFNRALTAEEILLLTRLPSVGTVMRIQ